MDNHKERIGNFRIEPPGLFRGRGDHPKMGMLKRRIRPEDIIINCSKWVISPPLYLFPFYLSFYVSTMSSSDSLPQGGSVKPL